MTTHHLFPRSKALSVMDVAFIELETDERVANIGPLIILNPPVQAGGARRFADWLYAEMINQAPGEPFNFIYIPPRPWQLPRLEPAASVDLHQHCHRVTLPAPGTRKVLLNWVCRTHVQRLDHSRPLWEFYIIDGLHDGRVAIYGKVHHGLIDGLTFIKALTTGLSADPASRVVRAPWRGLRSRKHAATGSGIGALARQLVDSGAALAAFSSILAKQTMKTLGMAKGSPLPFVHTGKAFVAPPTIARSFAYCSLPLSDVKAFGKAHGSTVNDVLLTMLDMALNRYLDRKEPRGQRTPLVADMPVALHGEEVGGNQIAVLQFPLGDQNDTPAQRLHKIHRQASEVKDQVKREARAGLTMHTTVLHSIPALTERLGFYAAPTLANAIISNTYGVRHKAYVGGGEVELALPISVLLPGQSLNITIATYDTQLQIAFLGTASHLPDIDVLADNTVHAFAELRRGMDEQANTARSGRRSPRQPPPKKRTSRRVAATRPT